MTDLGLKKFCKFLQSYKKTREMQKKNTFFFSFPSAMNFGVVSPPLSVEKFVRFLAEGDYVRTRPCLSDAIDDFRRTDE